MSKRKCIYTGKDAKCKDKVVPHDGGDIDHNWVNSVPCDIGYKDFKAGNHPSELEMLVARAFTMEELAKQQAEYWKREGDRLRAEIAKTFPKISEGDRLSIKKAPKTKKDKEIEIAYKQKEIQEVDLNKVLEKKKLTLEW